MKKLLFLLIGMFLLTIGCTKKNMKNDSFFIYVSSMNRTSTDRIGEDYIKLWVEDTLLFSGTYFTNYIDSPLTNPDDILGMKVANIIKANRDSVKIRVRLISLDSVLFGDKRVMDTTFRYRIDNIPGIAILDPGREGFFRIFDRINTPEYFYDD